MPHINQLVDDYGAKGFVAIGVTKESPGETRKFLEETGAKWTTVYDVKSTEKLVRSYPTAYLVDPSGVIIWKGHPGNLEDLQIKNLLPKVRLPLGLPSKYASINALFDKDKYGEAHAKIQAELAKENLPEGDTDALNAASKRIWSMAQTFLEDAKNAEADKDYWTALQSFDQVAKQYAGMEEAKEAAEAAARIQADPSLKSEIEAGSKIADAEKKLESGGAGYQAAWKILSAVIKANPDSGAAAKASKIRDSMKEKGQYGFSANCKECKKQGKACGECRTKAKW